MKRAMRSKTCEWKEMSIERDVTGKRCHGKEMSIERDAKRKGCQRKEMWRETDDKRKKYQNQDAKTETNFFLIFSFHLASFFSTAVSYRKSPQNQPRFSVLQSMARSYTAPPPGFRQHNALSMTTGLPSAMGRTWLTFPVSETRSRLWGIDGWMMVDGWVDGSWWWFIFKNIPGTQMSRIWNRICFRIHTGFSDHLGSRRVVRPVKAWCFGSERPDIWRNFCCTWAEFAYVCLCLPSPVNVPGLVNCYITNWNITIFKNGKST